MHSTRTSVIIFASLFVIYLTGALSIILSPMSSWKTHSSTAHSLLQLICTVLALFCGVAALYRFYIGEQKRAIFLFLGVGFAGTTLIDAYHTAVTASWFIHAFPNIPPSIAEWSWLVTRIFVSTLFIIGLILEHFPKIAVNPKAVYLSVGGLVFVTFIVFLFLRVPYPIHPQYYVARPLELIPGILFLIALIGYWRTDEWKTSKTAFWLILFLITSVCSQLMYNLFAGYVHDFMYLVAHILKIISYLMVYIAISD